MFREWFRECLEEPIAYNLCSTMSWSIVSMAFFKSIKIIPVIKTWSTSLRILSFKNERQKLVEWFLRKSD